MSLEQQLTDAIAAQNALTQAVAQWKGQVEATLANAVTTVNRYVADAKGQYPMPPNLIANSFMTKVDAGIPVGYSYTGVTIEAVHPFTKGFEGPYIPERPTNAANDPNLATMANPFWYGVYNKGPRLWRGGLADGWCGIANGNILKITASPDSSKFWTTVFLPMARTAAADRIGFRGFLKIVQGSAAGFGSDSGYQGNGSTGHVVTKAQTDAAAQGWMFLDFVVDTSQVTSMFNANFALGFSRLENIEVYLALPYAYIPAAASPGVVLE